MLRLNAELRETARLRGIAGAVTGGILLLIFLGWFLLGDPPDLLFALSAFGLIFVILLAPLGIQNLLGWGERASFFWVFGSVVCVISLFPGLQLQLIQAAILFLFGLGLMVYGFFDRKDY